MEFFREWYVVNMMPWSFAVQIGLSHMLPLMYPQRETGLQFEPINLENWKVSHLGFCFTNCYGLTKAKIDKELQIVIELGHDINQVIHLDYVGFQSLKN